jgi:integrase
VNLEAGVARIARSFSNGKSLSPPKTRRERTVELSARLREVLAGLRPDIVGEETLVFANEAGRFIDPHNFRDRVFRRISKKALGPASELSPHGLRHTFASLHLARGTNLKWIQAMGGWASAKLLLDLYGHFLPTETTGFADALSGGPRRPYTAPLGAPARGAPRRVAKS